MYTVEFLLEKLNDILWDAPQEYGIIYSITSVWDRKFITDICLHITNNKSLSTEQSKIAIKLITRYKKHLILKELDESILTTSINTPYYRSEPYISSITKREVRYAGNNFIVFKFKYNPIEINDIKRLKSENYFIRNETPFFDRDYKIWVVKLTVKNFDKVIEVIRNHHFEPDDDVIQYLTNVDENKNTMSKIVVTDQHIEVECHDDELFDYWINTITQREQYV